jgi:hypothetical protein
VRQSVNILPFINELLDKTNLWLVDTERQNNIFVQSETQTIYLKKAASSSSHSLKTSDIPESVVTENAVKFPLIFDWTNRFSEEVCGHLGRVLIVRFKPNGRVYRHIDSGEYYRVRDRFHLVLQSEGGSIFICEKEKVVMQEDELWWFNNKKMHEVINPSDFWRTHLIFDILGASF